MNGKITAKISSRLINGMLRIRQLNKVAALATLAALLTACAQNDNSASCAAAAVMGEVADGSSDCSDEGELVGEFSQELNPAYPAYCINQKIEYEVSIKTGNVDAAGTDANVYMKMAGASGQTSWIQLDHSNHNDFERGSLEVFYVQINPSKGFLSNFSLKHDNTGSGPGWYAEWVEVYDPCANFLWHADVNRWLNTSSGLSTTKPLTFVN